MHRSYFMILLIGLLISSCSGPQYPEKQRTETLLRKLSLRQRIGQMFITGVEGQELSQDLKRAIAKDYLGGFFLAPVKNFNHVNDAARLIHQFQKVAIASTEIPLLICAQQEGGLIQTLNHTNGATDTPGNFALGVNGGFEDTYSVYRIMARELRAAGFNLALAPIVNMPPDNPSVNCRLRLFSAKPDLAAKLAQAAVRGFQQNGIISAAGYFPEFTECDTIDASSLEIVKSRSGFQAVISEDVSAITIPPPALHSVKRVPQYLRNELGFKNLIISDALRCPESGNNEDAALKAIQAGADLIFQQTPDLPQIQQQIDAVLQAVESGRISRKRIDTSVKKILSLKLAYRLFETSVVDLAAIEKRVGTPEALQESLEISRRCVTVLKDSLNLLPLKKNAYQKVLLLIPDSLQTAEFWQESCFPGKNLVNFLQKEVAEIQNLEMGATLTDSVVVLAMEMAQIADLIIFLTVGTEVDSISKIINAVHSLSKPMIYFSVVPPENIFPHISTYLVVGGVRRISLQAAVDVLFGRHFQTEHLIRAF